MEIGMTAFNQKIQTLLDKGQGLLLELLISYLDWLKNHLPKFLDIPTNTQISTHLLNV